MIKSITIGNYRSFAHADIDLSNFNLVIGKNGSGKTNFLKAFLDLRDLEIIPGNRDYYKLPKIAQNKHSNLKDKEQIVAFENEKREEWSTETFEGQIVISQKYFPSIKDTINRLNTSYFSLDPEVLNPVESLGYVDRINSSDAHETTLFLLYLQIKKPAFFQRIKQHFIAFFPEIEDLMVESVDQTKLVKIKERGIDHFFPISYAGSGVKIVLIILTILYQEQALSLILLEDLGNYLEVRLYQRLIEMIRCAIAETGTQIIATTHNCYLMDQFIRHEEPVIIATKKDSFSRLTKVTEHRDRDLPLSGLWLSGFLGD